MCWLIGRSLFQWRSWFMVWSKSNNNGTRKQIERVSTAWEWKVAVTGWLSNFFERRPRQMTDGEDWSRLLQDSDNVHASDTGSSPFGRRQTMILKDADLIVAADKEIRMSSFGDIKLSRSTRKSYKVRRSTVFLSPENSQSVPDTAYAKPTVWDTSNIPQSKRETTRSCWNTSSCSRCPTSCRI